MILVVCLMAFALIVAASLLEGRTILGQNDASRWDTVWSLMNGKGYVIDGAPYDTIDKVFREGHFYSSKPALLPAVVAGITLIASNFTDSSLHPGADRWLVRLVLLIINGVPFVLFLYYYGNWLLEQSCSNFAKAFCLCGAAFGTFLTAYTITLNNHTVAAVGVFFAVLAFMRILSGAPGGSWYLLCGVLSAWAVANELVAWPFWFFMAGCLWKADRRRTLQFFAPGTLAVAIAFLVSTYIATGDCIPFYLKPRLYEYPGSHWKHPDGIDGAHESKSIYLFNYVLGHHGILGLTPIFLFAFAGMFLGYGPRSLRIGAIVLTSINALAVIFGTHNYGGDSQGARWFMWLIPIWLFCMPPSIDRLAQSSRGRFLAILALLVSVGSVLYGMLAHPEGPWSASWIHDCMRAWGWVSY
jgi:hypothetical protein